MASPYNSRRECQGGQANQDLWEYPWTPPNNTSPVFSNPGQSVSPSLRRAMPAQVPSTPLRSIGPILYSSAYGTAPTPWNVNAAPVACPNPAISTQHVPWADWGNSSQCNPPPRGVLQPAISFDSVAALSNAGVEDLTPVGGKDGHACDHISHNEPRRPSNIKCGWAGCTYAGAFTRESCLWRHIRSTHVSPGMYKCSEPQCNKSFGRMDKLQAHVQKAHMKPDGLCPSCHH